MELSFVASGMTHIGRVRATNQDAYCCLTDERLYIVADGMGGHAGGEVASQLCIAEIQGFLKTQFKESAENLLRHPDSRVLGILGRSVNHASTKIYERALEQPFLKGMGTTATVMKIIDDYCYYAHVGDSRLYLLRSGFLYQLTRDHSYVSEQVRAGVLTEEEAESHPQRNVITRSVGYQEEEDVDVSAIQLLAGDQLMMCSDGLHGKLHDRELVSILKKSGNPSSCQELISLANERGGEDNITVVHVSA